MKLSFAFSNCFWPSSDIMVISSKSKPGEDAVHNFHVFSYKELKAATNGFRSSNKIGEGGFGSVYKGRLHDGTLLAIKVLSVEIESLRGEREFIAEIASLSDIKHENLVTLRGYCVEEAKRILVYDHMEHNSLSHTFLGGKQNRIKFSWTLRRDISLGIARGLAYLHEEIKPHIIHRDIKASNILLDQNFKPKISDFGLSKLFGENMSHISTRVAGTLGYLSPEYAISGHLTRKSDVYSYGVLLLETVSGRSVIDFDLEHGEQFLVVKAWEMYNANNLSQLVDPVLTGDFSKEEAVRFLKIGLLCIQENTKLRPSMSTAIQMLNNEIDVEHVEILQPGCITDLMDVKIVQKNSSHKSGFFSKLSWNMSLLKPQSSTPHEELGTLAQRTSMSSCYFSSENDLHRT